MKFSPSARRGLTVVLAIYGFRILLHPEAGWFLDNVDLPIHETGHLVFSPFGEFMQFAGGTLFQLILPAVFVGYFFRQKDRHGGSIALWWVAQSLWNVSVYVKDARAQELPLVGGGEHDWAYLLGELNLLPNDQTIGHAVWLAGVVVYLVAIAIGLKASLGATDQVAPAETTNTGTPVSTWDKVAQCESGGNWATSTGNGFHGGLQFTASTWRSFGGSGMPHQASRTEQIAVAERVLAAQGWKAWPACSHKLGLR